MFIQGSKFKKLTLMVATLATAAFLLSGCGGGSDGAAGPAGPTGPTGPAGPAGPSATAKTDVTTLTTTQWARAKFTGVITGVTIASPPVVNFKVTVADTGENRDLGLVGGSAVVGLAATSKSSTAKFASYPNVSFTMAKLVPGTDGSPSKWVSYIVTTVETTTAAVTATRPSSDNTGTLVDNGDGSYSYTFYRDITKVKDLVAGLTLTGANKAADLGDLTYEPNLTHRVVMQLSGNLRGTGTNTADGVQVTPGVALRDPINLAYDFIPATGKAITATDTQRNIVATENCTQCHGHLNAFGEGFHGRSRDETTFCVTCHTDQRKFGRTEATKTATGYSGSTYRIDDKAVGVFPSFIHKLHMGEGLTKTGYNYGGVLFNEIVFPQDPRNCTKCHDGSATAVNRTPQGDNWKNVPNRLACGACHDGIDFTTGTGTALGSSGKAVGGHVGGIRTSDKECALCHTPEAIQTQHVTENASMHNPSVPAGLKVFKYEIKSADATATNVKIVFKITMDGTPVTFNAPAAGLTTALTGFTGSPGFLLAYGKSQDGVTSPIDYNNLGNGLNNAQPVSVSIANLLDTNKALTHGTLAGPDASGYYTATIVGAANIFPAGATLRSVGLQSYFSQITAPASAAAPVGRHTLSVVKHVTGDPVRRSVVDPNKCGNCHEWFEGHGGSREIGLGTEGTLVCLLCHNPGIVASARGIPDATLLAYKFTASDNAILAAWGFDKTKTNAALAFPQTSNNFKDMIHGIHAGRDRTDPIRIARDRTPSAITLIDGAKIGFPGVLQNCETCHKAGTYSGVPANTLVTTHEADNGVLTGGIRTTADAKAALKQPNPADKVTTPFTAACVSCHDSVAAKAHIGLNGGQILVARSAQNAAGESCVVCHGAGSEFDPVKVHIHP